MTLRGALSEIAIDLTPAAPVICRLVQSAAALLLAGRQTVGGPLLSPCGEDRLWRRARPGSDRALSPRVPDTPGADADRVHLRSLLWPMVTARAGYRDPPPLA